METSPAQLARGRPDDALLAHAFEAYGPAMFRVARALLPTDADAEDAVANAMLSAWKHLSALRDPARIRPWLMAITANCAREMHRQATRRPRTTALKDAEQLPAASPASEKEDGLWDAVQALPAEYRAVLVLFYYEELPIREIARALRLPQGTVKSRLARGRERLRAWYRKERENDERL